MVLIRALVFDGELEGASPDLLCRCPLPLGERAETERSEVRGGGAADSHCTLELPHPAHDTAVRRPSPPRGEGNGNSNPRARYYASAHSRGAWETIQVTREELRASTCPAGHSRRPNSDSSRLAPPLLE